MKPQDVLKHPATVLTEAQRRAYTRLTDNWLELTVRFLVPDHGIRAIKDAISREVLAGLREANIQVASTTVAVVEQN